MKNKIFLIIFVICFSVFSPLQASITGNRIIANDLVNGMNAIEPIFFMCCMFLDMLDEAVELQSRAYGQFDVRDEFEIRQLLLDLESRFNNFLNKIPSDKWCPLKILVKKAIVEIVAMQQELQALEVVLDVNCRINSSEDTTQVEEIVEEYTCKLQKIIDVLVKNFQGFQDVSDRYAKLPNVALVHTQVARKNTHAKMLKNVDIMQSALGRLNKVRERDALNQLKCGCNLWCELDDWVLQMIETIREMLHDLRPAEVVLDAKCPDGSIFLSQLTQHETFELENVVDELTQQMYTVANELN